AVVGGAHPAILAAHVRRSYARNIAYLPGLGPPRLVPSPPPPLELSFTTLGVPPLAWAGGAAGAGGRKTDHAGRSLWRPTAQGGCRPVGNSSLARRRLVPRFF